MASFNTVLSRTQDEATQNLLGGTIDAPPLPPPPQPHSAGTLQNGALIQPPGPLEATATFSSTQVFGVLPSFKFIVAGLHEGGTGGCGDCTICSSMPARFRAASAASKGQRAVAQSASPGPVAPVWTFAAVAIVSFVAGALTVFFWLLKLGEEEEQLQI
eukprot:s699_g9.t1